MSTLEILGMGSAYPEGTYLDNETGPFSPRTVLPRSYLESSGNRDPLAAPLAALMSPTDLAVIAAEQALKRAGILPEQLGLIIGDTLTTREKTPSEAQRVGKRFGLKVPAYDITCGPTAFAQHLDVLRRWKVEATPEYVLLLSSNTPTESVSFDTLRSSSYRFCDAASAMVVSNRHPGKLKVTATRTFPDVRGSPFLSVETFGGMQINTAALEEDCAGYVDRALAEVTSSCGVREGRYCFLAASASGRVLDAIAQSFAIEPSDRWYHQLVQQGDSLGSSVGRVIADRWDELQADKHIVVTVCGSGVSYGYAVLTSAA